MAECRKCGAPIEAGNVLCPDCAGTPGPAPAARVQGSSTPVTAAHRGVNYDPEVIRSFVQAMYARANTVTVVYTVGGMLLLGLFAGAAGAVTDALAAGIFIGALVGAFIGYFVGNMKANALRLEAQVALCQVEIEQNTRRHA